MTTPDWWGMLERDNRRCSYTRVSSVIATHWSESLACGRPRPVEKDTYGSLRTRTRPEETVDLFVGYPEYNTTGGRRKGGATTGPHGRAAGSHSLPSVNNPSIAPL